ncbi:STAS domain-containing protein [Streptomyces inhibens]|uniref:STAS domain-containing protein n=1 Tax=Streptomyces inhibens TaxID=2293571 RepID=UPI00402AAFAE
MDHDVIVRLPREVTFENARHIGQHLRELLGSGPTVLEIDLTQVTHLSPDGGTAFLMVLETAQRQGTRMIATHAGPRVRRVLHQLGLTRLIDVYDGSASGDSARPPSGGGEQ